MTASKKKNKKEDDIEEEFFEEMEFTDPVTGKKFIQKVKITRYKTATNNKIKTISEEFGEDTLDGLNWDFSEVEEEDDK